MTVRRRQQASLQGYGSRLISNENAKRNTIGRVTRMLQSKTTQMRKHWSPNGRRAPGGEVRRATETRPLVRRQAPAD
jgi:hypothetical protein